MLCCVVCVVVVVVCVKIQCYFREARDKLMWAFHGKQKIGDKRSTQHLVQMLKTCQTFTRFTDEKHEADDDSPPPNPLPLSSPPSRVSVCTSTTRTCVSTCARGAGTHGDVLDRHVPHTTHPTAFQDTTQHNMTHHTTPQQHDHNTTRRQKEDRERMRGREKRKKTEREERTKEKEREREEKTKWKMKEQMKENMRHGKD